MRHIKMTDIERQMEEREYTGRAAYISLDSEIEDESWDILKSSKNVNILHCDRNHFNRNVKILQ